MKYILDLNVDVNIPANTTDLIILNINHDFQFVRIPESVTHLRLIGFILILVVPDSIIHLECDSVGLSELYLNDNLEYLDCSYNNLQTLLLPDNIKIAKMSNNSFINISARKMPKQIIHLDVTNNFNIESNYDF